MYHQKFPRMIRKTILAVAVALMASLLPLAATAATRFKDEKLHYVISYKWGLIHKDAGDASLSLRRNGANYDLMLAAKTKPWADKVYMVQIGRAHV